MQITLDEHTKVVFEGQITVKRRPGGPAFDLARDRVLILDAATCQPIATLQPLGVERAAAPPQPPPAPAPSPQYRPPPSPAPERLGRLTDAQREGLERLIQAHPAHSADKIGELFEARHGRPVSALTVKQYQDAASRRVKPVV